MPAGATLIQVKGCAALCRGRATLAFCLSMIFSENRFPLFGIMI
jgi:hypothetical protein